MHVFGSYNIGNELERDERMEPFLIQSNYTDPTTKQMLQSLINKKLKYNKYKVAHFLLFSTTMLFGFFTFYLFYKTISKLSYSVYDAFSAVLNTDYFLYLLFIVFALFGGVKIIYEKKEKLEIEFHNLRCEIIDKSKDLWKEENWKQRHTIFEQMKAKYDINLYHESK